METPFRSVFGRVFDVVVFGGGYAGYAAARTLRRQGREVLLVERRAAILWESGWGFSTHVGASTDPLWTELVNELKACRGANDQFIDGAIAEVVASKHAVGGDPPVLYYATPIAAWRDGACIGAVAVATKAGVRVVTARQWVDATEDGELVALLAPGVAPAGPGRQSIHLYFRHIRWSEASEVAITCPDLRGARLTWAPTNWANERVLSVDLPGDFGRARSAWVPAMRALSEQWGGAMDGALLSHGSVVPVATYGAASEAKVGAPNVAIAIPGLAPKSVATLADRFEMGLMAARELSAKPQAAGAAAPFGFGTEIDAPQRDAQVAVAGAGTGGAFAAIAAARNGAQTLAFDPLPYAGGIGAEGGIHWYYYGVKGGLQEEADERTRRIMPLFGKTQQVQGFHPDAKKIVMEEMLVEAGVQLLTGATLYGVEKVDGTVTAARLATPRGPVRLVAPAWIDSTGDGDLCAFAGADFWFGRSDGQLHAYSQSSGRVSVEKGLPHMRTINFDAGFVDPIDPEDQTRGRLAGMGPYLQDQYDELERPTYIAPAIGLRQSRHIETDYMVSLADLVERRTFADAVGLTGCHYDNHAIDYEFESDEGMFWVWCCRQWSARTGCQMPYRMLLPRGLDNVWVACRAAGVTMEAHHSLRMQRDFQRLGEAAGIAAALAVRQGVVSRRVPYNELRQQLVASGALSNEGTGEDGFGPDQSPALYIAPTIGVDGRIDGWVADLKAGAGASMYHLWRHEKEARGPVAGLLASGDRGISWRAAAIVAMWSDPSAEPRLRDAVRTREQGFVPEEKDTPQTNNRLAPNWLVAVALLRRCGTPACLNDLYELSGDAGLLHNARTAVALTCQALAMRFKLTGEQRNVVDQALRRLLTSPAPNAVGDPQRKVISQEISLLKMGPATLRSKVKEDFTWQLHLAVAKAEQASGLPVHPGAKVFLVDPRSLVRRAFATILQTY